VLERAAALHGRVGAVHFNLGNAHLATGAWAAARRAFEKSVACEPSLIGGWINLAIAAERAGDFAQARTALEHAVTLDPSATEAHVNLGVLLGQAGDHAAAAQHYRTALRLAPGHVAATLNLATCLLWLDDAEAAEATLRQALTDSPDNARLQLAYGNCLEELGRPAQAQGAFETALRLAPGDPQARYNLALCRLARGEWLAAWPDYEARIEFGALAHTPPPHIPRWDGNARPVGALVVLAEQGIGDTLQLVRFGRELKRRGIEAHLACDRRLVPLLSTAAAFAQVLPYEAAWDPSVTAWCPLASLPGALATRPDDIRDRERYLSADPARANLWRQRLDALRPRTGPGARLRIGIAWQGNPAAERSTAMRGRSPPLMAFAPLAARSDVTLVPLQRGAGLEQMALVPFADRLLHEGVVLDDAHEAFFDTAALIEALDLVVTSDTSIAHLAGALGAPTWIALKAVPDWRWLLEGTDSPWYPSARLYRQARRGDWGSVFEPMARDLGGLEGR
jgi:Flp pilus assembly protein TadD